MGQIHQPGSIYQIFILELEDKIFQQGKEASGVWGGLNDSSKGDGWGPGEAAGFNGENPSHFITFNSLVFLIYLKMCVQIDQS